MGANANNNIDKTKEIWEYDEKIKKRELVVNTIIQRSASSSHQILQDIKKAATLSSATGSSVIEAIVLSGGYTNYSYKIFVPDQPHLCLFAKLTFERAVWNPDKDALYDLQRTVNEYEMISTFSKIKPDCVVAPLALWDVEHEGQKMKLLVTMWSKADEQFSNQFIDGSIDPRAAPKVANALAAINSMKDYDPHFNEQVKSYLDPSFQQLRSSVEDLCLKSKPQSRTEHYCAKMGTDVLLKVLDANHADFKRNECLIHSDSHAFNILVEAKPDEQDLDLFAPDGTIILCDFEMTSVGPFGRDAGYVLSWPLACMVAHAIKNTESNANIQIRRFIETFLKCYLSEMSCGRTAEEMAYMYRRCFGWAGLFMVAVFYSSEGFIGEAPGAENKEAREYIRDSMGVLGLKLVRLCYDTDYVPERTSLTDLTALFNALVDEELTQAYALSTPKRRVQPRKSSLLRISNRRISDAGMV
eukprot:scaffold304_cov80-Skeletonema_menzelii.AAC.7